MLRKIMGLLSVVSLIVLVGCGSGGGPVIATKGEISALAQGIQALGPDVDPEEAQRAARIAYEHSRTLAIAYEITDPPLVHNTKVNMGTKPRGLCYHWAQDMEKRMNQERFKTLVMHRAIANFNTPFLIEHSTAVISRRGDTMEQGIVLDPWRNGGPLFWDQTVEDTRYGWVEREVVMDIKRKRQGLN